MTMTKPINEKPEVQYFSGAAKSINFFRPQRICSIEAKRVQSSKSFVVLLICICIPTRRTEFFRLQKLFVFAPATA